MSSVAPLEHDPMATEETCPACQAGAASYGFRPFDHKAVTEKRPRDFDQQVESLKRSYPSWWKGSR